MSAEQKTQSRFRSRFRVLSRLEKAFYTSIIMTSITLAIGVVYIESRNQQMKQTITGWNRDISDAQSELNNTKQEINELTKYERISKIAAKYGLTIKNENIQPVE